MIWRLLPYLLSAAVGVSALVGVYLAGYHAAQGKAAQARAQAVQRAIRQAAAIADQDAQLADAYEKQLSQRRIESRVITKRVIEYVEAHADNPECFDTDGVQLINRFARIRDSPAPAGEHDATVRGNVAAVE